MNKAELRRLYLSRQKNLDPAEREKMSRTIAKRFFAGFDLSEVKYLHCFLPIEKFNEIETKYIFARIWGRFPQIQTVVPRVNFQTMEMESVQFAPGIETALNAWHINEPLHHEFVEAKKIDVILIPLLCFDCRGFRVGYGKGFYDRFLRACRPDCLKIGLSYFSPIEMITDAAGFDVTLDYCQTPENTWRF